MYRILRPLTALLPLFFLLCNALSASQSIGTIDRIDNALGEYYFYTKGNGSNYYDKNEVGKFKQYCIEQEYGDGDIDEELEDISLCGLLEFDKNNPFHESFDKVLFEIMKKAAQNESIDFGSIEQKCLYGKIIDTHITYTEPLSVFSTSLKLYEEKEERDLPLSDYKSWVAKSAQFHPYMNKRTLVIACKIKRGYEDHSKIFDLVVLAEFDFFTNSVRERVIKQKKAGFESSYVSKEKENDTYSIIGVGAYCQWWPVNIKEKGFFNNIYRRKGAYGLCGGGGAWHQTYVDLQRKYYYTIAYIGSHQNTIDRLYQRTTSRKMRYLIGTTAGPDTCIGIEAAHVTAKKELYGDEKFTVNGMWGYCEEDIHTIITLGELIKGNKKSTMIFTTTHPEAITHGKNDSGAKYFAPIALGKELVSARLIGGELHFACEGSVQDTFRQLWLGSYDSSSKAKKNDIPPFGKVFNIYPENGYLAKNISWAYTDNKDISVVRLGHAYYRVINVCTRRQLSLDFGAYFERKKDSHKNIVTSNWDIKMISSKQIADELIVYFQAKCSPKNHVQAKGNWSACNDFFSVIIDTKKPLSAPLAQDGKTKAYIVK